MTEAREKAKFTPGPWKWREDAVEEDGSTMRTLAPGVLILDDMGGGPWGDEVDRANARLIAAAPDLYEALRNLLSAAEAHIFSTECQAQRDAARAALSKAEGASQ